MKCPCCNGAGEIEPYAPVELTPLQSKIYAAVRTSPRGISGPELVRRVYADRIDGGPMNANRCVWGTIQNLNERLSVVGQRIVAGRGHVYTLQFFDRDAGGGSLLANHLRKDC